MQKFCVLAGKCNAKAVMLRMCVCLLKDWVSEWGRCRKLRGGLRPFPCHTHNKWFEKRLVHTHIQRNTYTHTYIHAHMPMQTLTQTFTTFYYTISRAAWDYFRFHANLFVFLKLIYMCESCSYKWNILVTVCKTRGNKITFSTLTSVGVGLLIFARNVVKMNFTAEKYINNIMHLFQRFVFGEYTVIQWPHC